MELPVPDNYNGYRDGILSSRLETINVFDGKRMIVYNDTGRIEAPTGCRMAKRILFNKGGLIYTYPLEGGEPQVLNTGKAIRNNNDHVISFDGKMLAISSHRDGMAWGWKYGLLSSSHRGEPVLVTDSTPSYLHGWSPNGKELVYTAQRISKGPAYNIYRNRSMAALKYNSHLMPVD
jgi:Tol biopolymer transport system component